MGEVALHLLRINVFINVFVPRNIFNTMIAVESVLHMSLILLMAAIYFEKIGETM